MTTGISRRRAMQIGTGAAASLPLVHIRTAGAAGKLALAFWDHWVPGGNDAMTRQINAWAAKNKVEVATDYMSAGNKLVITAAAEEQAKTGHDAIALAVWEVHNHARAFEPVDGVVQRLIVKYGPTNEVNEYLAKVDGHWMAVPSNSGSQNQPPVGRISALKDKAGLDVLSMYPVNGEYTSGADAWTWDAHLKAAEACQKTGMPFALGLSNAGDCVDFCGALFAAYGADLVDAKGNITVHSDAVRQVLEYGQQLVRFLPRDVLSYDSASNNRALISGQSALIFNPPSAWAVAKRDQPQVARDCWTFSSPRGPKGRFVAYNPYFWGIWSFSRNKSSAKDLLEYLCQREQVEERTKAVSGFDVPPFDSMLDFTVWNEVEPPIGTVYHYPIRPSHHAHPHVAGTPAAPEIAMQIYSRGTQPGMLAKLFTGQSIPQVIAWAEEELGGLPALNLDDYGGVDGELLLRTTHRNGVRTLLQRQDLDLVTWLRHLGLERYAMAFQEAEITPEVVPELTDQDLRELGIPLGPRRALLMAIRSLAHSLETGSLAEAAQAGPGIAPDLPERLCCPSSVVSTFDDLA